MNKIDCITLLGEVLTKIDIRRGSMPPGTPSRKYLDDLREEFSSYQVELADLIFKEADQRYKDVTNELKAAAKKIEIELSGIDNILELVESSTALLSIIDNLFLLAIDIG